MSANECIPFYEAAYTQKLTVDFDAAVAGKRFCAPLEDFESGPGLSATAEGGNLTCDGYAAANGRTGGVVGWDVGVGGKGPVIKGAGTILPVTSGASVTAGAMLKVDATGRVVPATQVAAGAQPVNWVCGYARSTVGAADLDVVVELCDPFVI